MPIDGYQSKIIRSAQGIYKMSNTQKPKHKDKRETDKNERNDKNRNKINMENI